MKQKFPNSFRLRVVMLVAILCSAFTGSVWGEDVTVTFTSSSDVGTGTSASGNNSVAKDGITISCTSGGFAISGGAHYRLGSGSTTTISSTVGNIKSIVFNGPNGTGNYSISKFGTNTGWTLDSSKGTYTWSGDAESVTVKANSGQVRPTSIVVTYTAKAGTTYTVTLADNNTELTETAVGAGVTLPSRDPQGVFSFAGWCESNLTAETTTEPTIIPAGSYAPTSNITLYPVFTRTETTGGGAPTNVSVSIADYSTANSWSNNTVYQTIQLDGNVSVTASTGTNTGRYYSNDNSWRIYSSESATLTFNSSEELKTITLTYSEGAFKYGNESLTSGTAIDVSGTEVILDCTTKAFVNSIAVTYGGGTSTTYYTSNPVETVVADPVITLASEYIGSTTATITCTTADATIQYSFDQTNWTTYTMPVEITTSTTIYAKATKTGLTASNIVSASTTRKLTTPIFSPNGGNFSSEQTVTLTSESGATIYYTTDGSEPTTSSTQYTAPFALSTDCTVKAKAFMDNYVSDVASATFAFVMVQDGFFDFKSKFSDYGSGVTPTTNSNTYIYDDMTWTAGNVTLVSSGKYRWWYNGGELRFYKTEGDESATKESAMTISVPDGNVITQIVVTGGKSFSADCGTYTNGTWNGCAQSLVLTYAATGSQNVETVTVTYRAVTLNASGYATFASSKPLDFTDAESNGYTAWQIKAISGSDISFEKITGAVAAGTGVLLKGTPNTPVSLVYAASGNDISSTNKLEGITVPTDIAADTYYGLSGNTFVKVNAGTVKAGKALLPATALGSNPARLTFVFEDETTTGISNVNANANDNWYDLQGRRVAQPQKGGLYIVNGKKVVLK